MTLAVTAADLRVGQGYVRCGRCSNVFNALLTLSEEPADTDAPPPSYSQADPASSSQIRRALYESAETAEAFEFAAEPSGHATRTGGPDMQLVTERSSDGAIENESSMAEGTGTWETIVLEGDGFTQTEEFVPEASVHSEIAALTQQLERAANQSIIAPPRADESALAHNPPASRDQAPVEAALDAPDIDLDLEPRVGGARRTWAIVAGCALLALLLAVQAIHHWRDALAASPLWSTPLNRIYTAIGRPLYPRWNLAAYDVRQQGAVADPNDNHVIRVRLSLANHADRAQPAPLLRLTLLDRYGKRIAARELTPAEYWPKGLPVSNFLTRDERIDSEIAVRDPDADSSSFELDVCLKSPRAALQCASEAAAIAPAGIGGINP